MMAIRIICLFYVVFLGAFADDKIHAENGCVPFCINESKSAEWYFPALVEDILIPEDAFSDGHASSARIDNHSGNFNEIGAEDEPLRYPIIAGCDIGDSKSGMFHFRYLSAGTLKFNFEGDIYGYIERRALSLVRRYKADMEAVIAYTTFNFLQRQVGANLSLTYPTSNTIGINSQTQTYNQGGGATCGQIKLEPRDDDDLLSRFRHRLLGGKVVLLTLCGFVSAAIGAFGFSWVSYYPDWKRKLVGTGLFVLSLPITGIFFGWAVSGRWDGILCQCFAGQTG